MKFLFLKILLASIFLCGTSSIKGQKISKDISLSILSTYVNRVDFSIPNSSNAVYHYKLLSNVGFEVNLSLKRPIIIRKSIFGVLRLGYRNFAYEGRHFNGVIENSSNPDKILTQYYFSIYRQHLGNIALGGEFQKKRIQVRFLFEGAILFSAMEKRKEVQLSNVFNYNHFFSPTKLNVTNGFNRLNYSLNIEISYELIPNLLWSNGYNFGLNSTSKAREVGYYYTKRSIKTGLSFVF